MAAKFTAVYVRASCKSQDTASQDAELKAWVAGKEDVRFYRDKFTGRTMDRPGWSKLAADMKAGKLAAVVVWRLDRLGRTARGLTALFDELRAASVNLVSLRDGLDLATPAGRLMANVLASVAQYETEVRSERQMAGIQAAKERGVRFGRPVGIRTRVKVTTEQEMAVRRLAAEGENKAAIARATGLSRPTIYAILNQQA
jgi:DNA invertase Pin-like site-specific DNA recombinase